MLISQNHLDLTECAHLTAGAALHSRTFFCSALFSRDALPLNVVAAGASCVSCAAAPPADEGTLVCSWNVSLVEAEALTAVPHDCMTELEI